jgi:hypothetical protein
MIHVISNLNGFLENQSEIGGPCGTHGAGKKCIHSVETKLGRSRRRWEGEFETDLKARGREGMNWLHVPQDDVQWRVLMKRR